MVTLTIHLPGSAPVSHVLKDDHITIGRMAGNTIVLNDASVSLAHARISRKHGDYILKDLNSTNGTQVNGQPVNEARLRDRDLVRFADVAGQFHSDETAPAAAAPGIREALPISPAPLAAAASPRPSRRDHSRILSLAGGVLGAIAVLGVVSFLLWNLHRERARETEVVSARTVPPERPSPPAAPTPAVNPVSPPTNSALPAAEADTLADPEVPRLIKSLQDPDPAERRQAVAALHSLGPAAASATPALHQALSDPDQEVRLWSALALINIKSYDKAIPPILVHELQDEKPMLRQLACVSLGLLPYEPEEKQAVVPALLVAAESDVDEDVRKAAAAALGVIAPDASNPPAGK